MATDNTGVTASGFVTRSLSEIRDDFRASIQNQLGGTTVDLSSTSIISQLIDVFANGLADLWAAGAGIYAGNYPAGATGVQVDQLLALSGLTRVPACATTTSASSSVDAGGNPLYGLVAFGTAGAVLPKGSLLSVGSSGGAQFAVDADIAIAAAANAQQAIQFSNSPTVGAYVLALTTAGGEVLSTPNIDSRAAANATTLIFPPLSQTDNSNWTLTVGTNQLTFGYADDAAALQGKIRALTGFSAVTVTGSRDSNMLIYWPAAAPSLAASGANAPSGFVSSIQDQIWALRAMDGSKPFGDVLVQAYGQGFLFLFGGGTPASGATSTGSVPVPLIQVTGSSLYRGNLATAVTPIHLVFGHPAQGTGSATATSAGAQQVLAGQLNTLVSPVNGISSVTNMLDCVTGQDIESDAAAIARLQTSSSQTSATIAAIAAAVQNVSGVTQAIAFANDTNASSQILSFSPAPTSGSYALTVAGQTTSSLPYSASAQDIQSALQSLPGLIDVTVTTAGASAFELRFGAQSGHQPHDLALVATNSTNASFSAAYACPAHAVEVVAQGGDAAAIAAAIFATLPAGIASYGRAAGTTTASIAAASNQATLASATSASVGQIVDAAHLPTGTQLSSLTGQNAVLSQAATATNANESISLGYGALLDDTQGNSVVVRFSRAAQVTIFANLTLVTDKSASSQFQPSSIAGVQQTLIGIINAIQIGKPVIVSGTQGLLNSFRDVAGIQSASLTIGRSASSQTSDVLILAPNESPSASAASVNIQVN